MAQAHRGSDAEGHPSYEKGVTSRTVSPGALGNLPALYPTLPGCRPNDRAPMLTGGERLRTSYAPAGRPLTDQKDGGLAAAAPAIPKGVLANTLSRSELSGITYGRYPSEVWQVASR